MNDPNQYPPPSPAASREARRTVLALIIASFDDDEAGYTAVMQHTRHPLLLLPAALGLLTDTRQDHGINVREWIAGRQRQLLETEAHGNDTEP